MKPESLHLSLEWCTLYSSMRRTRQGLRRWCIFPGKSRSYTRHRYEPECTAARTSRTRHTSHHTSHRDDRWLREEGRRLLLEAMSPCNIQDLPTPGCFLHMIRSGWCLAMATRTHDEVGRGQRSRGLNVRFYGNKR